MTHFGKQPKALGPDGTINFFDKNGNHALIHVENMWEYDPVFGSDSRIFKARVDSQTLKTLADAFCSKSTPPAQPTEQQPPQKIQLTQDQSDALVRLVCDTAEAVAVYRSKDNKNYQPLPVKQKVLLVVEAAMAGFARVNELSEPQQKHSGEITSSRQLVGNNHACDRPIGADIRPPIG